MNQQNKNNPLPKKRHSRTVLIWTLGIIVLLMSLTFITMQLSPWPSAMLIRYGFNKGGKATNLALEPFVPQGIARQLNIPYTNTSNPDTKLDIYSPATVKGDSGTFPVIVWIHGGAWLAGSKEYVGNYCKILAGKNYIVAAINYSLAPASTYPTQLFQVNQAIAFLKKNAWKYNIDPSRFILAGDSGGAQVAAQMAGVISNRDYAREINIEPSLSNTELAATLLYCGAYDFSLITLKGSSAWFLKTVLWSFTGDKHFSNNPAFNSISITKKVTVAFPPTFISVGNDDPLAIHSHALAARLNSLGVKVDSLFFTKDHQPALPHEYQFNLNGKDGQLALQKSLQFLSEQVKR
ncbi:alpha/beta hydrolase [Pedobacter heparinus]|uniref:alpha/beta hydrolase n=1 Tax=Pedobacter heparinus TaxID=984 RepID=UPI002931451B|nr:alpha/beta hydrolase [Pedobacter heparinus]